MRLLRKRINGAFILEYTTNILHLEEMHSLVAKRKTIIFFYEGRLITARGSLSIERKPIDISEKQISFNGLGSMIVTVFLFGEGI